MTKLILVPVPPLFLRVLASLRSPLRPDARQIEPAAFLEERLPQVAGLADALGAVGRLNCSIVIPRSTSSHVTGIDTGAPGLGRTE